MTSAVLFNTRDIFYFLIMLKIFAPLPLQLIVSFYILTSIPFAVDALIKYMKPNTDYIRVLYAFFWAILRRL